MDHELTTSEVTAWQVAVMGPTINFDISSTGLFANLVITSRIDITPSEISILDPDQKPGGPSSIFYEAVSVNQFASYRDRNLAGSSQSPNVFYKFHLQELQLVTQNDTRVHATVAVPEPDTFLLLGLFGLGMVSRRKSKRLVSTSM